MKRFSIIAGLMLAGLVAEPASAWPWDKVRLPFFEPLSPKKLCGGDPKKCQPTSSRQYTSLFNDKIDYDGVPRNILATHYNLQQTIFERKACANLTIEYKGFSAPDDDVTTFAKTGIKAKSESETRATMEARVNGDLDELIRKQFPTLPADLQAKIAAEVKQSAQENITNQAEIDYYRMDLSFDFINGKLQNCISSLPSSEFIITGASIVTISGDQASKSLSEALAKFETSADYQTMSANLKADYQSKKNVILNTSYQPIPTVISVAFRPGTKQN